MKSARQECCSGLKVGNENEAVLSEIQRIVLLICDYFLGEGHAVVDHKGAEDGSSDGAADGLIDGAADGLTDGAVDGFSVESKDCAVAASGANESTDGCEIEGIGVRIIIGVAVGENEGIMVGFSDGRTDGEAVGRNDGIDVGV